MNCSRCGSEAPNSECFVCDEPLTDEADSFSLAKESAMENKFDSQVPSRSSS